MTDRTTIEQDLAFLRQAAEDGARLSMPGVPYYILWGLVSALANGLVYLSLSGALPLSPTWIWGSAGAAASVLMLWLIWRDEQHPEARKFLNRAVGLIGGTTGGAAFVLVFGVSLSGADPALIGPVIAVCLGIPFIVFANMAGPRWMTVPGFGWWIAAAVMFAMHDRLESVLIMAAAAVMFMVLPGLALLRLTGARMV